MLKTTNTKRAAVMLIIIGGATSAISGSVFWVPYVVTGAGWRWAPEFGFISFVLGIVTILGGILLSRGRIILGTNLAIWCGIANLFFGFFSTVQAIGAMLHPRLDATPIAFILGLTLTVVFPVFGGTLGLMYRKNQIETEQ